MFKKIGGLMMVGALAVSATAQARPAMPGYQKLPRAKQLASFVLTQSVQVLDELDPTQPAKASVAVRLQAGAQNFYVQLGAYVRTMPQPGMPPVSPYEVENALTVTDVEFVVPETRDEVPQPLLVPTRVARSSEEHGTLVVVESMDLPALASEMQADFGSNEAG